ncbi:MAG: hypothetical protein RMJ51_06255 [Candidatus Calescibacterium sp.]|nr:hypothetical protein [Candidatus Calescibacterium sp.]MCX7971612.1 hypothetical protein [bacterium]MDW8195820.1 hypothetical protein [Candidatus Calescibacterium sp.]
MIRKILSVFIILLVICLILNSSSAKNYYSYNIVNYQENKYSISLGIWNTDLKGDTFAPSTVFTTDLEDDLGFGNNKAFVSFDFNYMLSNLNSVGFSFFTGSHKAVRTQTRNITLPGEPSDVNVPAGTTVFSEIKYSAFDLYYRRYFSTESNYSFYSLIGTRFNNLKADFSTSTTDLASVFSTSTTDLASIDFNVPVVYVGIGGDFRISDSIKAFYQIQGIPISISGEKVNYIEYKIGFDYKFTENWGLSIGYRYNSTKAEDDFSRSLKTRYQGFTAGLNGKF